MMHEGELWSSQWTFLLLDWIGNKTPQTPVTRVWEYEETSQIHFEGHFWMLVLVAAEKGEVYYLLVSSKNP